VTNTSNPGKPSGNENKGLEAYITVDGHKAKTVFYKKTRKDYLIS